MNDSSQEKNRKNFYSKKKSLPPKENEPFLLPGIKPVLELLEASPEKVDTVYFRKGRHSKDMDSILDICRSKGVRFSLLETTAFARVYEGSSQGIVARLYETGFVEFDDLLHTIMDAPLPLIVAFDQVQDPGNAGTFARTLYALGGAGLVVPKHNGVYLGAGASKASAGALSKLPVARVGNLGQAIDLAKKAGLTIYGAAAEQKNTDSPPLHDIYSASLRLPALLILGSEETGLRPIMEKRCDMLLRVPMLRTFDSINVAQAGAILLSHFVDCFINKKA